MIGQYAKGRVAVFIDAANIYYSLRNSPWRIDFSRLKTYLEKEVSLVHIAYYTAFDADKPKQKDFLTNLEKSGYVVIKKELKKIAGNAGGVRLKGSLDVELALDAFEIANRYDVLVLFSGDSDFAPLIDKLHKRKISTIVVSKKDHISLELLERAKYIKLSSMRSEIELVRRAL